MPRIANKAQLTGFVLTVFLVYWGFLPLFWPPPTLRVAMPAESALHADVPIVVTIDSWHPNFDIVSVRFYVDHTRTDAEGPEGLFYPQLLMEGAPRERWRPRDVNRFTWPRHRRLELVLPLGELAAQGLAGPGTIRGKIDVTLAIPNVRDRLGRHFGGFMTSTRMISEPFELKIDAGDEQQSAHAAALPPPPTSPRTRLEGRKTSASESADDSSTR